MDMSNMDGYGLFVETLKGNFVAIAWYPEQEYAEDDAKMLNAASGNEDFYVRKLNYSEYQKDMETA